MANADRPGESPGLMRLYRLIEQPKSIFDAQNSLHTQVQSSTGLNAGEIEYAFNRARRTWRDALEKTIEAMESLRVVLDSEIEKLNMKLEQRIVHEEDRRGVICQLVMQRWAFEAQAEEMAELESID